MIQKSVRLKEHEAKIVDFCNQTGLARDRYREQQFSFKMENGVIASWGKSVSSKAVAVSQKHYDVWRKSIGAENTPKTLAKYYDMKYNDKAEYSRLEKYVASVSKSGDASPLLGYDIYREKCLEIERELIGIKTVNNIEIKDYSAHFVCRAIGKTNKPKPNEAKKYPVDINDIKDALMNGQVGKTQTDKNGERSVLFLGEKCKVSINPDKGKLIQTNERKGAR